MVGRVMIDPRALTAAQMHVGTAGDVASAGQPRAMTNVMESFVDKQGRTLRVEIRQSDGLWDGTLMCQSAGRRLGDYEDTKGASEYKDRLVARSGISMEDLVVPMTGRNSQRHTWVHRKVAIHLAQWISPDFAVWVAELVERYLLGQLTTEESKAAAAEVAAAAAPAASGEDFAEGIAARVVEMLGEKKRAVSPDEKKRRELRGKIARALRYFLNNSQRSTPTVKWAAKMLGCTMEEFKLHIERNFQPWMNWSNWGPGSSNWHLDHDKPLRGCNPDDPISVGIHLHHTNFMPRRGHDNIEKGDRLADGTRARDGQCPGGSDSSSDEEEEIETAPKPKRPKLAIGGLKLGEPLDFYLAIIDDWIDEYRRTGIIDKKAHALTLVQMPVEEFVERLTGCLPLGADWKERGTKWQLSLNPPASGVETIDTAILAELRQALHNGRFRVHDLVHPTILFPLGRWPGQLSKTVDAVRDFVRNSGCIVVHPDAVMTVSLFHDMAHAFCRRRKIDFTLGEGVVEDALSHLEALYRTRVLPNTWFQTFEIGPKSTCGAFHRSGHYYVGIGEAEWVETKCSRIYCRTRDKCSFTARLERALGPDAARLRSDADNFLE